MHDYWSENASNDSFHFSVSVIELEFKPGAVPASHFEGGHESKKRKIGTKLATGRSFNGIPTSADCKK